MYVGSKLVDDGKASRKIHLTNTDTSPHLVLPPAMHVALPEPFLSGDIGAE
jgi:hypothetical protein